MSTPPPGEAKVPSKPVGGPQEPTVVPVWTDGLGGEVERKGGLKFAGKRNADGSTTFGVSKELKKVDVVQQNFKIWVIPCYFKVSISGAVAGEVKVPDGRDQGEGSVKLTASGTIELGVGFAKGNFTAGPYGSIGLEASLPGTLTYSKAKGLTVPPVTLTVTGSGKVGVKVEHKEWGSLDASKEVFSWELYIVNFPVYVHEKGGWQGKVEGKPGKDLQKLIDALVRSGAAFDRAVDNSLNTIAGGVGKVVEAAGGDNAMREDNRANEAVERFRAEKNAYLKSIGWDALRKYMVDADVRNFEREVDRWAKEVAVNAVSPISRGSTDWKAQADAIVAKARTAESKESVAQGVKTYTDAIKADGKEAHEKEAHKQHVALMKAAEGDAERNGNALSGKKRNAAADKRFQAGWQFREQAKKLNQGEATEGSKINQAIDLYNKAAAEFKAGLAA